uniref:Probable transport protein n=1 Tax=Chlorokybus atmophyticus TaxID=3144 RepID=A2CI48_CHLAT|nr:probable transport protein [Chlorokybus atmophyticus]ABM87952.1 probable transport protein [Chlorokybus atmophyticus]WKT05619.1 sulfate ABC transporter protein [Chlorokybus atmophyticus]
MSILIDNVSKRFGSFQALKHVNLEIKSGSLMALIGPSGSGKSTLLRIIAGLETPDTGKIWLSGKDASNYSIQSRNIGFVFQNYALFKHMTVYQNISFGLELRGLAGIPKKVEKLLELIQLQNLENRYPIQLSGGQRQRIALARALAIEPKVLLLDEPFGALDARVRRELRGWLRNLHERFSVTTILVTHDQQEAMEVADEIVVFHAGRIEQIGKPQEIYDHPATPFVFGFLGGVNVIPSDQPISKILPHDLVTSASNPLNNTKLFTDKNSFYIRPHDISIQISPDSFHSPAKIDSIVYIGNSVNIELILLQLEWKLKVNLSRKRFKELKINSLQQMVYIKINKSE